MIWERRADGTDSVGGIAAASATTPTNLNHAERAGLIAVIVIFSFLATLAIFLRYLTIWLRGRPIGMDDYVMAVAFVAATAFTISTTMDVVLLNPPAITITWLEHLLKLAAVDQITSNAAIYTVKLSILCLYLRISGNVRNFLWWASWAAIALISVQFLTTIVVWCVQCIPLERSWKPWIPGHCINFYNWWLSFNGFHIFSDVLVLMLPMTTVWKLEAPLHKRLGVVCLFSVGCIPVVAGCLRLKSLLDLIHPRGSPWIPAVQVATWGFIELDLGIVCACVPTIRILFVSPKDSSRRYNAKEASPQTSEKPSTSKGSGRSKQKFSNFHITSFGDTVDEGDIELVQRPSGSAVSTAESQIALTPTSTVAPLPTATISIPQRRSSDRSSRSSHRRAQFGKVGQCAKPKWSWGSHRRPSQGQIADIAAPVLRPEPEDYSAKVSRSDSTPEEPECEGSAIMVHTSFSLRTGRAGNESLV